MANVRAFLGCDTAVDLGTANTRVFVRGRGLVLDEPSVVAVERGTGKVVAVGTEAKRMTGRTPAGYTVTRPLRCGVIADFDLAERMLRSFLGMAHGWRRLAKPRVVIAVPGVVTTVERRAVEDAAYRAGARRVYIIEGPVAAAMGAGLVLGEPAAAMVVDIGAGATAAAIMSMGGVVAAHAVRTGGYALDRAIISHVRARHALLAGELMAEEAKLAISAGRGGELPEQLVLRGRDVATGLPRTVTMAAEEVRKALAEPVAAIVGVVQNTLEDCPPELSGDLMDRGIALTGGGALLHGLVDLLREETGLPIHLADDPFSAVVLGAARYMESLDIFRPAGLRTRAPAVATS